MTFILLLLLQLLALAIAAPTADTVTVCKYLLSKYPGNLAFDPLGPYALLTLPLAENYTTINQHYWNVENSLFYRSGCTFFPATAEQVSDAVRQLNAHPSVPFALKGGGHNPAPGFSATKDGVLISFAPNLAGTVRSQDGKTFTVGVGARWGDVYKVTGQTNQVVVGGRLADIGVAGFVLGGGLSYYSAQYGLACDNVENWEAVLANGTVVNANRTFHPDLWWALRGGGNQFAIITRVTLQAHPAGIGGQVWGGTRAYTIDKRQALHRAIANFTRDYPDAKAAVIPTFQFGLPANLLNVITGPLFFFFYDGPKPPAGLFADFDAIESLTDDTKAKTYYDLSQEAGGADITGFGNSFRATTFPNLPTDQMEVFYDKLFNLTYDKSFVDGLSNLDVQILGYDPQPLSVRVAKASQAQGGNALSLDPAHGDRIWIEHNLLWLNQLCDTQCPAYAKSVADAITSYQKQEFAGIKPTNYKAGDTSFTNYNPVFMNDAAPDQEVYPTYGSSNLARLQAIKAAYDPTGFFTRRQGGFKLP